MNYIRELFAGKDKKSISNLIMALGVGIVMLLCSNYFSSGSKNSFKNSFENSLNNKTSQTTQTSEAVAAANISEQLEQEETEYEKNLEKRLEEMLSAVSGAGNVKVMITLLQGREIVIAKDFVYDSSMTKESDAQGGSRESLTEKSEEKKLIINDGKGSRPIVLTENTPKVLGVIIIAQGGDDIIVKDALTKAAQVVLGVDINKIQVLKMK